MRREYLAIGAMAAVLIFSNLLAIALATPFLVNVGPAFGNPQDVANVGVYIFIVLGFTAAVLFIVRIRRHNLVRYLILGSMAFTIWFVFSLPLWLALRALLDAELAAALAFYLLAPALALGLTYALLRYPEWYIVDAAGLSVSAGVTAIIGISFGILPALLLLAALALYDAIAVYKTKHMVTLADTVSGLRLPVLLVIPRRRGYSFLRQAGLKEQIAKGEEREAMFMGLGDIIVPGILVVSSFAYLPADPTAWGVGANLLVALLTLLGSVVGFAALMRFVLRGNPQAGLPLLNGGAIVGYIISYYILYRNLTFGVGL